MSIFSKAKTLEAKKPATKADKAQVQIDGLEFVAALDAEIKALTALKASIEGSVKSEMGVYFVKEGCAKQTRPENFRGVDGDATASCELRARGSNSPLVNEDEIALLTKYGIEIETVTSTVETFVINPAYLDDQKIMEAVGKALEKVKGIPEDFIMKQQGVSKKVVGKNALDQIFKLSSDVAHQLLSIVGVLAVKPVLGDATAAKKIVDRMRSA